MSSDVTIQWTELRDMIPAEPSDYAQDGSSAYAELFSESGVRNAALGISGSYLNNLRFGQTSSAMAFSNDLNVTPFSHSIGAVVSIGAEEKMAQTRQPLAVQDIDTRFVVPNTLPYVARMADDHPRRDWPIDQFPRNDMSTLRDAVDLALAVSPIGKRSIPKPAPVGFSAVKNSRVEQLGRHSPRFRMALLGAVKGFGVLHTVAARKERAAAHGTGAGNEIRLWTHSGSLLYRLVGCRAPDGCSRAGVFACLNYTAIRHEMAVS
jgi:hypothetical protein